MGDSSSVAYTGGGGGGENALLIKDALNQQ